MPKYRTVEAVTYADKGKVVSVEADRLVELNERQAEKLAGSVELVETAESFFPAGGPVVATAFARNEPETSFTPVAAPEKAEKPKGK